MSRIDAKIGNKPYLKLYQQKNATHDGDREKPNSMVCNMIVKKLKKNKQNLLFGLVDEDEARQEQNLDLANDMLVGLG